MNETARNLEQHVRILTELGVRLAGSSAEQRAAAYLRDAFLRYVPDVSIEEFPVRERCVASEKLEIRIGDSWQEFPCSSLGLAPSTGGRIREADIAFGDVAKRQYRPLEIDSVYASVYDFQGE